ncbi:hypothetical protein ALC56_05916 [Trachymyrmex septentrionalis]|uniref:Uncharacterized protein n=1 Tax=Trachymyrmex septentrionalis TaxID=34720 RepID=A0A195FG96_9HYME|nr:hypothetical protein ALC56_05916 [Trachymyrmex septentrionalis]
MSAYLSVEIVLLSGFWFCSWARGCETEEPTIYYLSFLEKVRLNKRAGVLLADDGDAMPSLHTSSGNNAALSSLSTRGLFSVRANLIKAVHFSFITTFLFANPPASASANKKVAVVKNVLLIELRSITFLRREVASCSIYEERKRIPDHEEKATAVNESLSGSNEGKRWRMQQLRESNAEYFRRYLNSASGRGRRRRNRRRRVTDVVSLTLILSVITFFRFEGVWLYREPPRRFRCGAFPKNLFFSVFHGTHGYKPHATAGTFVHSDTYSHAMDLAT